MDPAPTMTEGPSTSQLEPVVMAMVEMSVSRQDHQTANQVVTFECFRPMLELQACPEICLLAPALQHQGLITTMMVIAVVGKHVFGNVCCPSCPIWHSF
jgi:hypothetical protein